MKKNFYKLTLVSLLSLFCVAGLNAQNQEYWREGFNPEDGCDLGTVAPTVTGGTYFIGGIGTWYAFNVYRTTGTGCPAGNNHVRYKNISGVTDSGYLVTPIVNFGINELHFLRARASRSYTIWMTSDTSALTSNWTVVDLARSSAATVTCVDTTIMVNSATAKRLKIVGRPGTDTDVDSIWITSFSAIVPVKFGAVNASLTNGLAKISWDVLLEINTEKYYIERSANGTEFATVGSFSANNAKAYSFIDAAPLNVTGFYRIKAVDKDGKLSYSNIVRLNSKKSDPEVMVTPNPITNGTVNLQLNNFTKSTYTISLFDASGRIAFTNKLNVEAGSSAQTLQLSNTIAKGMYQLQITNGSTKINKAVVVQ
ncbi:MAG: T9SS type A sorting domain-containing protein [Chitinophagaceae bacterium]|jgi:hypothetical protein|nr:T9SS type A sorting domain-containing protein [Chitinophagaceae bacterium]MBP9739664.1 T9SS type A sorting domain-containing protein [Chitinophagaceae bacterium]